MRGFFTPWTIAWLAAWSASSLLESWAWVFCFGLAWIMHWIHKLTNEMAADDVKETGGVIPVGVLAGVTAVGAFFMLTAWVGLVYAMSLFFGWGARPI